MPKFARQQNKINRPGRLKKRPEFLAVNATGLKWVSKTVIVQVKIEQNNQSLENIKYGVTATKRVGNAVIRNRCKRRLRVAINHILQNLSLKQCHIVLVARHNTATCEWKDLINDLQWCLKRLDLTIPPLQP